MNRITRTARSRNFAWLLAGTCLPHVAAAQDIEPRRWTPLPVGTNILSAGYVYTSANIAFDPALRLEGVTMESHTALLSYNRYLALLDRTARIDVRVPITTARWEGLLDGAPASTSREGLGDPRLRLSVNLVGAPALDPDAFAANQKEHPIDTTVGAALAVQLPLGEYQDDKLLNLGENRFSFRPQLGVLHRRGPWSFELTGSASLFTENDDFFGGNTLRQDPLYELQAHVVRTFGRGYSLSAGAAYVWGGETSINGDDSDDARSTLLYGATFGFPVARTQTIQVGYIGGVAFTETGADTHRLFVNWALRF